MPRFFFNLVGPRPVVDPFGLLRRDNEMAIEWGEAIAEGLARRRVPAVVVIRDEHGQEVAQITVETSHLNGDYATNSRVYGCQRS